MTALVFETYFYLFAVVLSIGGDIGIIRTYNDMKKYTLTEWALQLKVFILCWKNYANGKGTRESDLNDIAGQGDDNCNVGGCMEEK